MTLTLPDVFRTRPPTLEDAEIVVGLFTICQQAEYGTAEVTRESTLAIWQTPDVDLAKDIWLVFSHDNQLVAYLQLRHEEPLHMNFIMKVYPNYDNLALQAFLLERAEERAKTFIPDLREDARVRCKPHVAAQIQPINCFLNRLASYIYAPTGGWRL